MGPLDLLRPKIGLDVDLSRGSLEQTASFYSRLGGPMTDDLLYR